MENNDFNRRTWVVREDKPTGQVTGSSTDRSRKSLGELSAELDELAVVPTEVLADWVTARGRCLWESTFGDPPEWSGDDDSDRELAHRLCAGCPVRSECLEFELRVAADQTVGVWGGLNADDRLALHKMWRSRRRDEIADPSADEEASR
jgi:WhiB family redox-sensing transcriptional regulator